MQGGSYIDTCNLDGETNLKIKTSLTITRDCTSVEKVINTVFTLCLGKSSLFLSIKSLQACFHNCALFISLKILSARVLTTLNVVLFGFSVKGASGDYIL